MDFTPFPSSSLIVIYKCYPSCINPPEFFAGQLLGLGCWQSLDTELQVVRKHPALDDFSSHLASNLLQSFPNLIGRWVE